MSEIKEVIISKKTQTQDKMNVHNSKAFLITCMDFRFVDDEIIYMTEKGYDVNYDIFVLAGVSIGINQTSYPNWKETLFNHIEISKKLHHIKEVILLDHLDCGAYKTFAPKFENEQEEKILHYRNLMKAAEEIREKFPDLKVIGEIMGTDRKVEHILEYQ